MKTEETEYEWVIPNLSKEEKEKMNSLTMEDCIKGLSECDKIWDFSKKKNETK